MRLPIGELVASSVEREVQVSRRKQKKKKKEIVGNIIMKVCGLFLFVGYVCSGFWLVCFLISCVYRQT